LVLGVALMLLTNMGVKCFATGDASSSSIPQHGLASPPFRALDTVTNYRRGPPLMSTALFTKKDQDEEEEDDDENSFDAASMPDSSMNFTGPEPMDLMVPPVLQVGLRAVGGFVEKAKRLRRGNWPCLDEMDRELIKISLPVIGNFAIAPLIGAVDLLWVNRMGNALAVAGQSAANQVFSSAFWFTSFLPSGKGITMID
jgi:hypothetical protein